MLEEPRRARVLGARLGRARGRNFGWRMPNKGCREAVCAFGRGVRAGRAALGRAMGRGDGGRFAAFTLVDAFAPKKRIHFGPQNLGETACKVFFKFQVQVQESPLSWSPSRSCSFRCVSSSPSTLTTTASLESTFDTFYPVGFSERSEAYFRTREALT